jgi:hypothetical protein
MCSCIIYGTVLCFWKYTVPPSRCWLCCCAPGSSPETECGSARLVPAIVLIGVIRAVARERATWRGRANRQRGRGHVTVIPPPNVFHAHFLTVNDRKSNFQKGIRAFLHDSGALTGCDLTFTGVLARFRFSGSPEPSQINHLAPIPAEEMRTGSSSLPNNNLAVFRVLELCGTTGWIHFEIDDL